MAVVDLNDYLKLANKKNSPLFKGLIQDLLRKSDLIGVVPFKDVAGLTVKGSRWQTVPGVAFRKIGGSYSKVKGETEDIEESLFVLGGEVQIDRLLAKATDTIQNPLEMQMNMLSTSMAFQFNDSFINGDQGVDPDSFEGCKKRVSNMPARMTVSLSPGAGDSLKVLASSANRQTFLDGLHEAIKVSNATHLLMNEDTYMGLGQVLRRESLLDTTQDNYGRTWDAFASGSRKIPLIDVGLKNDKSTEIILNTEDPGDGGADATSIYAVRIDVQDGLHGVQLTGTDPEPYDPLDGKEMEDTPAYMRRVDWAVGLFNLSQYCIARLKDFKMAAA